MSEESALMVATRELGEAARELEDAIDGAEWAVKELKEAMQKYEEMKGRREEAIERRIDEIQLENKYEYLRWQHRLPQTRQEWVYWLEKSTLRALERFWAECGLQKNECLVFKDPELYGIFATRFNELKTLRGSYERVPTELPSRGNGY